MPDDINPEDVPLFPEGDPVSDSDGADGVDEEIPEHVDDPDALAGDESIPDDEDEEA
jgi:hypothetical protein